MALDVEAVNSPKTPRQAASRRFAWQLILAGLTLALATILVFHTIFAGQVLDFSSPCTAFTLWRVRPFHPLVQMEVTMDCPSRKTWQVVVILVQTEVSPFHLNWAFKPIYKALCLLSLLNLSGALRLCPCAMACPTFEGCNKSKSWITTICLAHK